MQAHLEYNLCTEAANAAIRKYYKDDVSDLINCMDLGFHHLLKNALMMRTSAIENLIDSEKKSIDAMDWALGALNSRWEFSFSSITKLCFTGRTKTFSLQSTLVCFPLQQFLKPEYQNHYKQIQR